MIRRRVLLAGAAAAATLDMAPADLASLFIDLPTPSLDLNFLLGLLDSRITFTRASVGTFFDSTGTMQTASSNVARFDYDPTTFQPRGLLVEESRTNSFLNSATLSTQNVTVTAVPWTLSFYGTGTVTLTGASTAGPLVGTGVGQRVSQTFTPSAGTLTCTVSGTVSNAQIEAGAFPTSYIPTVGSTVTRAADLATMTAAAPWFNAVEGTLSIEFMTPQNTGSVQEQASLNTDGNNNYINRLSGLTMTTTVFVSSSNTGAVSPNNITLNSVQKWAHTYNVSGITGCLGVGNDRVMASATGVPSISKLSIGTIRSANPNGWTRRVRYYPRVLTVPELMQLTTT